MLREAVLSVGQEFRRGRFSDETFATKPQKPPKLDAREPRPRDAECPYCERLLPRSGMSIPAMFKGGIRQMIVAVLTIVFAVVRCARFAIAGALCVVGFVGACCRALGLRIAHPEDRRLLQDL